MPSGILLQAQPEGVYAYCPSVITNNAPFTLKGVGVQMINIWSMEEQVTQIFTFVLAC